MRLSHQKLYEVRNHEISPTLPEKSLNIKLPSSPSPLEHDLQSLQLVFHYIPSVIPAIIKPNCNSNFTRGENNGITNQ